MANRSAAQAFGIFFNLLAEGLDEDTFGEKSEIIERAKDRTEQRKAMAWRLWPIRYQFVGKDEDPDMGCDGALVKLGLASIEETADAETGKKESRVIYL